MREQQPSPLRVGFWDTGNLWDLSTVRSNEVIDVCLNDSTTVIKPNGLKGDPVEDDRDAKHFSHRREKRKCRRKTSEYGDLVPKVQHDAQPNVLQRSRHDVSGQELRLHDGPETWAICTRRAGKLHKARSRRRRRFIEAKSCK